MFTFEHDEFPMGTPQIGSSATFAFAGLSLLVYGITIAKISKVSVLPVDACSMWRGSQTKVMQITSAAVEHIPEFLAAVDTLMGFERGSMRWTSNGPFRRPVPETTARVHHFPRFHTNRTMFAVSADSGRLPYLECTLEDTAGEAGSLCNRSTIAYIEHYKPGQEWKHPDRLAVALTENAKVGDDVVFLLGATSPVILRKTPSEVNAAPAHVLIGTAMLGENAEMKSLWSDIKARCKQRRYTVTRFEIV